MSAGVWPGTCKAWAFKLPIWKISSGANRWSNCEPSTRNSGSRLNKCLNTCCTLQMAWPMAMFPHVGDHLVGLAGVGAPGGWVVVEHRVDDGAGPIICLMHHIGVGRRCLVQKSLNQRWHGRRSLVAGCGLHSRCVPHGLRSLRERNGSRQRIDL